MDKNLTSVIVSGMPGDMATRVYREIQHSKEFMIPMLMGRRGGGVISLTGMTDLEEIAKYQDKNNLSGMIEPARHDVFLEEIKKQNPDILGVNFADAKGYDVNFKFVKYEIPFICGSTGATKEQESELVQAVKNSNLCAVIDKNMSIPLVLFGEMLNYAAREFPGALKGYTGFGVDEHQASKADGISGTLLKWADAYKALGIDFTPVKGSRKGDYGHADHFMRVSSPGGDVRINWMTEVMGRETYAKGTVEKSLPFLRDRMKAGEKGKVYSMTDVLKG
jgi:dihydrodipicolinate reductase